MTNFPLLSVIIFLPLLGAFIIALFLRGGEKEVAHNAKNTALWITIATLLLSIYLVVVKFNPAVAHFQLQETFEWIEGSGIRYHLGVDGISIFFVLLTTLLMPICILASWNSITERVKEYMIAFLALESLILGVFCSLDFLMFYFFFEAVLIPMFLLIGIWGGENRVYAAFKFFLYTLLGSVLMLIALLYIYYQTGTMNIAELMVQVPKFSPQEQRWLWIAFLASFAVKVPMWPVHTWLPDAHVQAPTAGSVILAGVLLKLGGYGFLRLSLPMLPDASVYFAPLIYGLSIVAIIYTSLVAFVQTDMKKLIAYSSIAHMGYVTLGIFAFNAQALQGALFQMLSHGIVSAALFLCVGVLYDRLHTKEIAKFGGLVERMPKYALMMMVFTLASVGLPGTSGFVGEFLVLLGVFQDSRLAATLATSGVILGAVYMLWLYRRVVFGELVHKQLKNIKDLDRIEVITLVPLALLAVVLGVYPSLIFSLTQVSIDNLITQVQPALLTVGKW